MKFSTKSLLFNGGIPARTDVLIPAALMNVFIPDEIWKTAVKSFNKKLDDRNSFSVEVNGVSIEALQLEIEETNSRIESVVLLFVADDKNIVKMPEVQFRLKGHLTFDTASDKVEGMVIEDVVGYNQDGKSYGLLTDNKA